MRTTALAYGSTRPNSASSTSRGKRRFSRPAKVPSRRRSRVAEVPSATKSPLTPMSNSRARPGWARANGWRGRASSMSVGPSAVAGAATAGADAAAGGGVGGRRLSSCSTRSLSAFSLCSYDCVSVVSWLRSVSISRRRASASWAWAGAVRPPHDSNSSNVIERCPRVRMESLRSRAWLDGAGGPARQRDEGGGALRGGRSARRVRRGDHAAIGVGLARGGGGDRSRRAGSTDAAATTWGVSVGAGTARGQGRRVTRCSSPSLDRRPATPLRSASHRRTWGSCLSQRKGVRS